MVIMLFLLFTVNFLGRGLMVEGFLDPGDFLALQSIRKSLEDMPGSTFFDGWDFTSDPCTFPGVLCAGDRVIALSLGDPRAGAPGLTGRLDPAVGRLTALTELTLVPGRVFSHIPSTIGLCSDLRFLALSRNFLSGPIPPSLAALRRLRTLDLSYNILSGKIPPAISSIPELSNIVLCHNRLNGSIPYFPESINLLRLDLKRNDLSGQIPPLPATLQYLSLSTNRLAGAVDGFLPRLNRLNYLDLSMNQLTGAIPGVVFSFPLQSLQLQRNQFTGLVVPETPGGGAVTIPLVDLSYNRLSGQVPAALATAGSLYLNNNRFTGVVPAAFVQGLQGMGMQVLYLQHNFLTGIEIGPTAAIPTRSSLCLQYNCMVPPVDAPCPLKAGPWKTRPADQCPEWRG